MFFDSRSRSRSLALRSFARAPLVRSPGGYPPSGGNGGSGNWGKKTGGGGGGGGGGGSPFALLAAGFKDRMKADPEFVFKVLTEQIIGVGASVLGDMSSRKDWGIHELDFVFATLIVGSIINFSLMWFLAPTACAGSASASFTSKFFGDFFLKKWGAPTGHMFQPGFSVAKRATNFAYKVGIDHDRRALARPPPFLALPIALRASSFSG